MSTIHSFFIPSLSLTVGESSSITKKANPDVFHQIHTVFRAKKGMCIYILDNIGKRYYTEIREVTNKEVVITTHSLESKSLPTLKKLWLPIAKPSTLEVIVKMCTEIGITHYQLYESSYSNLKYINKLLSSNQVRRLNIIIQEAAEQSEKFFLPAMEEKVLDIRSIPLANTVLALIERSADTQPQHNKKTYLDCTDLLIGPEGGFSEEEKTYLLSNEIATVSFPEVILKVETAAVIGAGMMCLQ